ncbi:solute carrier family 13 member 5-like [Centruroides sculpturatus]|uniref:solute carrier family 13 member 5-like n=1 Tax=Centruroides sculpturatus TaxID=218467 RepID=UPI000C6CEAA7|nr:solute carrier family 13 member 5-like [Centruroides sculpturatus]
MACYYVFEPIPAAVTSLFPIVLFPILGIMPTMEITPFYYKDIIMMFLGSLIIAAAVEECNLHRRIALKVLLTLGTTIRWLMVGFIVTTMFLSMWMVNTSVAALMVPIVEVVVDELEKESKQLEDNNRDQVQVTITRLERKYQNVRKALLLSVAYSSICGGLGTEVGTAPNLILVGLLEDLYPESNQVNFLSWMMYNIPGMILCNIAVFVILQVIYVRCCDAIPENRKKCIKETIEKKYRELGNIRLERKYQNVRKALLLSVAYSSICGGLGTEVGTAPNLILVGLLEDLYPESNQVNFLSWMMYNIPGMILCNIAVFVILQVIYVRCCDAIPENRKKCIKETIEKKYRELGNISFHELAVVMVTLLLVASWMFRSPNFMRGWASVLCSNIKISNSTPAMAASILMFIIPANPFQLDWRKRLLNWKTAQKKVAWGILLIFGGGFAIAEGAKKSKLTNWIALQLAYLPPLSPVVIVSFLCIMTSILTEVMTNSSTATLLLPVANKLAIVIKVHPLYLMMPLAICASFSFMLPIGSPSSAIAYETGNMKIIDLVKPGIFLNIVCCAIQICSISTYGYYVFDLRVPNVNRTEIVNNYTYIDK